jgi:hypothetical protein
MRSQIAAGVVSTWTTTEPVETVEAEQKSAALLVLQNLAEFAHGTFAVTLLNYPGNDPGTQKIAYTGKRGGRSI